MRIRTTTGDVDMQAVDLLSQPPPVGLQQGWSTVRLVDGPGGEANYVRLAEIYRTNPWVWAAVQIKARGVSRLPLHTFEWAPVDVDGEVRIDKQRVRSDQPGTPGAPTGPQLLDQVLRRPRPGWSRRRMIQAAQVDRGVYGNCLLEILKQGGIVSGLRYHRWANVKPHLDDNGDEVEVFQVPDKAAKDGRRYLDREQVIHIGSGDDPDSPLGVSPISSLRYTHALYDAVQRYLRAWFGNSASPSGHVELPPGAKPDQAARVRDMVSEFLASPENAGRVLVTSGKYSQMGETPEHSEVVELAKLSREEVAAGYHIPQPMIGILDRAIMSNVKELRSYHVRDVIGPEAETWESEFGSQLLPHMRSWRFAWVEFQTAQQLRPDPESEAEVLQKSDHLTLDEKREVANRRPLRIRGVTDVPWAQAGAQPVTSAAEQGPTPAPPDDV